MSTQKPPLIVHVIYRLDIGGLETVLVDLINAIPDERYRHVIISLTDASKTFAGRIQRDVPIHCLHKRPGQDWGLYFKLWRLFRRLRPDIVQSYNIGTLESLLPAFLAGVHHRLHAEHGRDIHDLDGTNKKYIFLRKLFRPLVACWVAVSQDLHTWLMETIAVDADKAQLIYNGIDPALYRREPVVPESDEPFIIGTVGRIQTVKNQMLLAQAFVWLNQKHPEHSERLRLMIVGDGALLPDLRDYLQQSSVSGQVELLGARDDVPACLAQMHVFVLPSLSEGIAITILEAMASGLPVIATRVGGNPELVSEHETGYLVPSQDVEALADKLLHYLQHPQMIRQHGQAARHCVEMNFCLDRMALEYLALYDQILEL